MDARILIVSNEAFSDSGSNSRTIKNLLLDIPKENIAQFYLHGTPDRDFCECYFRVSDNDALRAFCGKKRAKGTSDRPGKASSQESQEKPQKSYRNYVLRNIVWQSLRWWGKDFDDFLQSFCPDIVLLQAGDAPFMYAIARRVARKCGARLVMYNSESYVLKKRMYASQKSSPFWHFWLMSSLKKQYRKFMANAHYCIYSVDALEAAYQEKYPHPGRSCTLYTVSTMERLSSAGISEPFSLLYCGNLGVGRADTLAMVAENLEKVAPDAFLDIYGKFAKDKDMGRVCGHKNVRYGGVVSYEEVTKLMSRASLLLHCENPTRLENLKYAFSTKIADCLSSGIPFLVYADRKFPFVDYLQREDAAHIACDADQFFEIIKRCREDDGYRCKHIENACALAAKNHSIQGVAGKMKEIVATVSKEELGR